MFTLASMANVWAKGGPYDFLKSAELHNHICPGLTSGYLMAHYILDHFPLKDGERYTVVACPVWCKEDAFQVVMDCTPGKKGTGGQTDFRRPEETDHRTQPGRHGAGLGCRAKARPRRSLEF